MLFLSICLAHDLNRRLPPFGRFFKRSLMSSRRLPILLKKYQHNCAVLVYFQCIIDYRSGLALQTTGRENTGPHAVPIACAHF